MPKEKKVLRKRFQIISINDLSGERKEEVLNTVQLLKLITFMNIEKCPIKTITITKVP